MYTLNENYMACELYLNKAVIKKKKKNHKKKPNLK